MNSIGEMHAEKSHNESASLTLFYCDKGPDFSTIYVS